MKRTFSFFSISPPVSSRPVKYRFGFATIFLDRAQLLQIRRESLVRLHAILKALQVGLELGGTFRGQRINHPILVALHLNHSAFSQISEVLGNLYLRLAQDRLEMTNAEGRFREQLENAQARRVAET